MITTALVNRRIPELADMMEDIEHTVRHCPLKLQTSQNIRLRVVWLKVHANKRCVTA